MEDMTNEEQIPVESEHIVTDDQIDWSRASTYIVLLAVKRGVPDAIAELAKRNREEESEDD